LRGNGNGTLQPAQTVPVNGHANATDLGDLDGDGDLDWVVSSFGGQEWRVFRYDAGTFTQVTTFASAANPACAALVDIDNDRDLDIVLFTETSDEIVLKENGALDAQTYCYGTSAACPCANAGTKGHGCENSSQTGGGLMNGSGRASTSSDALALVASGLPSSAPVLYFQGDAQAGGGAGTQFGDGLLCLDGTIIRLGIHFAVNGYDVFGLPAGDPSIAALGLIPAGGATRYYQGWYRDSQVFCTTDRFNLTNAVRLVWTP
jgi:FG-GAP-like repeat